MDSLVPGGEGGVGDGRPAGGRSISLAEDTKSVRALLICLKLSSVSSAGEESKSELDSAEW